MRILKFARCILRNAGLLSSIRQAQLDQRQHEPSLTRQAHPLLLALIVAAIIW